MELKDEYERHTICGVDTIVWKWFTTGSSEAGCKRRKKLKTEIGREHLDIPMLDMRRTKNKLEFCDIVINTRDIKSMQDAFHHWYGSDAELQKIMSSVTKLLIQKEKKHFISLYILGPGNSLFSPQTMMRNI